MDDSATKPHVIVIAGPNGAGKSTLAPTLLQSTLGITEFVNADVIAQGLSAFRPENAAIDAGRIMLKRLKELGERRQSFAFETTLASRTFAPWIAELIATGYGFELLFLYLPSEEAAVNRVANRVLHGGHSVPPETIRRRYDRGLRNLFNLYIPLATRWCIVNNGMDGSQLIAKGSRYDSVDLCDQPLWNDLVKRFRHEA